MNWTSLHSIVSSHSVQTSVNQDGTVSFLFENIMLADSNTNELLSHGYVRYIIQLNSNLPHNSQIINSANIYFDSNLPVLTNSTRNTIYNCDSVFITNAILDVCLGGDVSCSVAEDSISSILWEIDSFYSVTNDSIVWLADTVGNFNMKIIRTNELCSQDSLLQIIVYPLYYHNDSVSICPGDSVFLAKFIRNFTRGVF